MASLLSRVGRWSATHAKTVIAVWLLIIALLAAGVATAGTNLTGTNRINESESVEGLEVLSERLPQAAGASEQVLFTSENGSIDGHQAAIRSFIEQAQAIDGISQVSDPFAQQTNAVSPDGTSALVTVQTDTSVGIAAGEEPGPKATIVSQSLDDLIRSTEGEESALTVQRGGTIGAEAPLQLSATEFFGVVVALIVLLVTLGSLVAAGTPLVSAFIGVGTGMLGILLASSFFEITTITPVLAIMIGLAVGIDYALFILSRTREHLAAGSEPRQAAALANATAGSAVVFAGSTVLVGLCALAIARIPFLTTMGLAAAAMVFVAMLVSITVTPALTGLVGDRLAPRRQARPSSGRPSRLWLDAIARRPALSSIGIVLVMAAATIPMSQVHLSLLDNGSQAKGTVQRDTYDAIAQAYGPGYNSPIIVVADIEGDPLTSVSGLAQSLGQFDGVERVAFATPNMDGTLAFVQIIPEEDQQSTATTQLVTSIRDRASSLESQHGLSSLMVTGQTAVAIDIADQLSGALAPFAIVVVGLSLVLLLLVFRSIAVPLVATAGFLLSIGTAMGALGAVYGWGWAADFLRVAKTGAVMSFTPIVVMGVLFGLAMDYQVFLVSRMREVWIRTGDGRRAVREGFAGSAKVVTAAAIIMTAVFAAFIPESSPMVKPIALALTIGIAADAFLVRMTLVPAVMFMLGARAWWIPRWLDRILPNVDIEGQQATGEESAEGQRARALVTPADAR